MSAVGIITRNTFNKIFKNLAVELSTTPEKIQLGIYYEGGNQKFEVYQNFKKEKDIEIDDYCGAVLDFSGGTEIIKSTIAQAGAGYAKELNTKIDFIKIVMQYKENSIPNAVLVIEGKKVRSINIEEEFLN